jgi:hypothetical protein
MPRTPDKSTVGIDCKEWSHQVRANGGNGNQSAIDFRDLVFTTLYLESDGIAASKL